MFRLACWKGKRIRFGMTREKNFTEAITLGTRKKERKESHTIAEWKGKREYFRLSVSLAQSEWN